MAVDRLIAMGGMNTELFPNRLPEGAADRAINVLVDKGDVSRRDGFDQYEDDVNGSAGGVLSLHTAHFSNGSVYVIAKVGATWYRRKVSPTAGAEDVFTAISGGHTHNATDAGWSFMWDDYIHLCDREGVSKWNPTRNSGTAYKAGLPVPSTSMLFAAAGYGEKDGMYHAAWSLRNHRSGEESVVSGQQTPPIETHNADAVGGALATSNWIGTIRGLHSDYEWDEAGLYVSFGHTEWDDRGDNDEQCEKFSHRLYLEYFAPKSWSSSEIGLFKADSVLDPSTRFTNAGGEPPGARFGCYDGVQAVYGGVYDSSYAGLTTSFAGNNNDLTFTSKLFGSSGRTISIAYQGGETAGAEKVWVSSHGITVGIDTNATTGSTASQIATAVEASSAASALVSVANATNNDGSGRPGATMSRTNLSGKSLVPDRIDFSLPGHPTMVPAQLTYYSFGDLTTINPVPWEGRITTGLTGSITAVAAGGGRIFAFSPTVITELIRSGTGRLQPAIRSVSAGCLSEGGAVSTIHAVYAMGYNSITAIKSGGMGDLAEMRIRPTLEAIPAATRDNTVSGYYGHAQQVWWAIAESGATVPQSILIYDEGRDAWLLFRPGCLGTRATVTTALGTTKDITYTAERCGTPGDSVTVTYTAGATAGEEYITVSGNAVTVHFATATTTAEQVVALWNKTGDAVNLATAALAGEDGSGKVSAGGPWSLTGGTDTDEAITALCELATPDGAPVMLVGTDAGRILQYPSGTQDGATGAKKDYAAAWRGYVGQGGAMRDQYLVNLSLMPTANCADNVRVGLRAMRMGWEDPRTQWSAVMSKDTQHWSDVARQGPRHGRIFQVEIFSPQTVSDAWVVSDMHARIEAKV